jgi:hypothetical protein
VQYHQVFPLTIAALELCAGAVYAYNHHWRFAIIWACVGVANLAFAGAKP